MTPTSPIDVSYGSVYVRNSLQSLNQTPEKSVQQMSKSLAASPLNRLIYTGSSGLARSTRADSIHAHYKNVRIYIVKVLKLPAKRVLFSIIYLDSTGANSRSCGFF